MDKHFLQNKVNCTLTVKIQVFPSGTCTFTLVAQSVLQHCLEGELHFSLLKSAKRQKGTEEQSVSATVMNKRKFQICKDLCGGPDSTVAGWHKLLFRYKSF